MREIDTIASPRASDRKYILSRGYIPREREENRWLYIITGKFE